MNPASSTTGFHENISPSAWGTAYQRTLTDIPYSVEIFSILDPIARQRVSSEQLEQWKFPLLTPMFEARFKLVDLLLRENGTNRILEIAAGFSPRGIAMSQDGAITYVEMDLPDVAHQKRAIIRRMQEQSMIGERANLYVTEGNALNAEAIQGAAHMLGTGPVAVVNEGLLRYMDHDAKVTIATNIRCLLSDVQGVWITPDVTAKGMNAKCVLEAAVREQNEQLRRMTGLDVRKNYFESESDAHAFFEDMGFSVERRSFKEVLNTLVSPEREGLTAEQVEDSIGESAAYVMRPK